MSARLAALVAVLAGVAGFAVLDRGEAASPGAHGGEPVIRTGAIGRTALDGDWVMRLDPRAMGTGLGWQDGAFAGQTVRLPHVPNAGAITGEPGVRSHAGSVAWYRTTVTPKESGPHVLRFESVNHRATVWLDGRQVADHRGVYLPFEVRVGLEAGREHVLVVRADWRSPSAMKRAGWHRTWFNFGGINREVTIRRQGPSQVRAPTVRTRLLDGGRRAVVDLSVQVRNWIAKRTITPTAVLGHGERRIEVSFGPVEVPRREVRVVRARVEIADPALWSTEDPQLWDLVVGVPGESGWRGRVGLREVRREGKQLLLNGRPLTLMGASIHEDARGRGDGLLPEDMDALIAGLQALGANATRAQHPLSPALLERLDAAGILVWQGIGPVDAPGAWTSRGPAKARRARERVRETLRQAQTHPSILAWNLANEVAGQGHPAGQVAYVRGASAELKRRDPGRLVALDIWGAHPPRWDGPMYEHIDAIGWTNYIGWYESTWASTATLSAKIRARLAELRAAFPDRVIAVTEFGAEGNDRNRSDRPGGFAFQSRLLRTHIDTYRTIPGLAGMLVWNLRDFAVAPSFAGGSIRRMVRDIDLLRGLNEKGLWTYDHRAKPSVATVRQAFLRARRR